MIEGKIFQLFCTQVIPTKERHGAFMHYLGTILLALAPDAEDAVPDLEAGRKLYYKI